MSTFSQWRTGFAKENAVRQITWICGPERILVEDIVSNIKTSLDPEPWNYIPMMAGEDSERAIWAEADQHPVDSGLRLVVIRNAERLKDWDRLLAWIKARSSNPRTHLLFVSNEERIPRLEPTPEEARRGGKGEVVPYLAAFVGKGHTIECRPFTQATAKHAVKWVQDKVKMRDGIASHMLDRANGDLRLVRDVCTKLAVFPDEITLTIINGMLSQQPRDSFSDSLLALDKASALLALESLHPGEYGRTIGLLDSRLELVGLVHDMQSEFKTASEIARAAGNKNFLVADLLPVAKHYDFKRRLQIRKVLALADEAQRAGAHVGVMEAIVAFW